MNKIRSLLVIVATIAFVGNAAASEAECREIARREYPDDARMQQYVYNQQMSADRYMATVTDADVKQIALREHPHDFSMQKYVYDQQVAA